MNELLQADSIIASASADDLVLINGEKEAEAAFLSLSIFFTENLMFFLFFCGGQSETFLRRLQQEWFSPLDKGK